MTIDDAIRIMIKHILECGQLMPIEWVKSNSNGSEFEQATMMLIEAANKQIPKQTIWKYDRNNCPVCMNPVFDKYCPYCGQALDWSNDNG